MSKVIVKNIVEKESNITLSVKSGEKVIFVLIGIEPGKKEIIVELSGREASVSILGIFLLDRGKIKIRTVQHHQAFGTTSDLLFKSILFDKADFSYHGLIRVDEGASGSNAYQHNDNILMSQDTKVDTRPELEILTDEVRCTHGATVGQVSEDEIYYLMSRGLSRSESMFMVLKGFFSDVLDRIPDEPKRREILDIIIPKLEKGMTNLCQSNSV